MKKIVVIATLLLAVALVNAQNTASSQTNVKQAIPVLKVDQTVPANNNGTYTPPGATVKAADGNTRVPACCAGKGSGSCTNDPKTCNKSAQGCSSGSCQHSGKEGCSHPNNAKTQ